MNYSLQHKLLLAVSLGTIAQLPQTAKAESIPAESILPPDAPAQTAQLNATESAVITSIATPEVITAAPIVPEAAPSEVAEPQVLIAKEESTDPNAPAAESEVAPAAESSESKAIPSAEATEATPETTPETTPEATTPAPAYQASEARPTETEEEETPETVATETTDPSRITVAGPTSISIGTKGIPPITDLPPTVKLPPKELLPANFELPINMVQAVDSSIKTSSPITDRFADPIFSEHLQTVKIFLATQPEAMTTACNPKSKDCRNIMEAANPTPYAERGKSLSSEDPIANPNRPSALGPIVRERLRMTVQEVQADREAYSKNLMAWSDRVRQCMDEKPRMYVKRSDGALLPVYFDSEEGTVVRNAEDRAVCAMPEI